MTTRVEDAAMLDGLMGGPVIDWDTFVASVDADLLQDLCNDYGYSTLDAFGSDPNVKTYCTSFYNNKAHCLRRLDCVHVFYVV
jgi:hypothetical protein